jgi:hypothetical protein
MLISNSFVLQLVYIIPEIIASSFFAFGAPNFALILSILPTVITILDFILWYLYPPSR